MVYSKIFLRKDIVLFLGVFLFLVSNSFAEQEWKIQKSTHFIVYYNNCSDSFLYRLIDRAETVYREITQELRFFRDEPWLWDKRALVYVFDKKEDYIDYTDMPSWSTGCARPFEKTIYTYSESYEFFQHTLTHELAHLIFREFIGKVSIPLWLDEGVAVYLERLEESSSMKIASARLAREGLYMPFNQFLKLNFKDLDNQANIQQDSQEFNAVGRFYLQSFSIVYFLIKEYDQYKFTQLLRKLKEKKGFEEAFLSTYRAFKNIEEFERQWIRFYR